MKLFCAYAFTGEDTETVTTRMRMVVNTLNAGGHNAYCNKFDEVSERLQEKSDVKGIFQEAFKNLKQSEAVVAVITSPNRSIGQIMELGVALSQDKPVYLFAHSSSEGKLSYLPRLVDKYFQWDREEELQRQLKQL